jgi:hypothetical protein
LKLSSVCWEKNKKNKRKKKREVAGGFLSRARAGHDLLAVLGMILEAVRCNYKLM